MEKMRQCERIAWRRRVERVMAVVPSLALLALLLVPAHAFNAPRRPAKIAVVGGSAAGVVAATVAAEEAARKAMAGRGGNDSAKSAGGASVTLFTSSDAVMPHWRRVQEEGRQSESPILPDPTLPNRKLIGAFPVGGREMAGILSKKCTPAMIKEWLENHGVWMEETTIGLDGALGGEKPLVQSSGQSFVDAVEGAAIAAGVLIRTGVNATSISKRSNQGPDASSEFVLSFDEGSREESYDCLIFAGEEVDFSSLYANNAQARESPDDSNDPLESLLSNEPLSRKERMELEKKKKKEMKKLERREKRAENDRDSEDAISNVKKDAEQPLASNNRENIDVDNVYGSGSNEGSSPENDNFLYVFDMVSSLGHEVSDPVPAMFSFLAGNDGKKGGMLHGCAEGGELIPKARLSIKLDAPPDKVANRKRRARSLPKHTGPLVIKDNEVTGSAALRLSAMTANQLHNAQFDLHLHLAPDIGSVEPIEEQLSNHANDLVTASCPLVHREIDYDDYDVNTDQFRQIEVPLVPGSLWENLCQRVAIPPQTRWCDIPPKKLRGLAHLLVDCPLRITGIQPAIAEFSLSGGVKLKEVDMASMESKKCSKMFLCGPVIDVNGFDGGFSSLASLSTGYVAGYNAAAKVCHHLQRN